MGFFYQTWVLTQKNLRIVFLRSWFSTTIRALILPIAFMFFISYAKNFLVPPATFGIGSPAPIRTLPQALNDATGNRHRVVLVHNGFTDGDIGQVVNRLATTVRDAGRPVEILADDNAIARACPSSLRGVSQCFGAVSFHSSKTQPTTDSQWNYTLRADGSLGTKIYVDRSDNDAQLFVLPFQHAIDSAIASVQGGTQLPDNVQQFPYTNKNQEERAANIVRLFQQSLIDIIAVAFFIAMVGVTYQCTGHMAMEREQGMSQLIEAMMPNKRRWQPQAARLLALHLSFDIMFLPGWIINGLIVSYLVFPDTNVGIIVIQHLLGGLALTSLSILVGSFFKRAQLSGIIVTILCLVLAIIAQIAIGADRSTGLVAILSLLFTPMNYVFFLIWVAGFQQKSIPANLLEQSPATNWADPGLALWALTIVQIFLYPMIGAFLERRFYGTSSKTRVINHKDPDSGVAVSLNRFSKWYSNGWFARKVIGRIVKKNRTIVKAVEDLTLQIRSGQIMVLLGANGSGKSTTLDAIAGLSTLTKGSIEIDGRGGLGLCPQKNVLWDQLTVREHVTIFNRLKTTGQKATRQETEELIIACDLAVKLGAKAGTLSGGQKRKLQLAMMFTGGSRVCCVDEVSSGIDPLARRKVWDILLNERGKRTILLTTHFLDEADVLSDHIAMLSKGVLKAESTAVQLKQDYGGGYRVSVANDAGYKPSPHLGHISHVVDYDRTVYHLPSSSEVSSLISDLDRVRVDDYSVEGPTVEDVFLRLADEIKDDFAAPGSPAQAITNTSDKSDVERSSGDVANDKSGTLNLLPGEGTGLLKQSWILFRKRFAVLRSNFVPYIVALALPVAAAGLVTLFLKDFRALSCSPEDSAISNEDIKSLLDKSFSFDAVYGPPNVVDPNLVGALYPGLNATSLHPVDTLQDLRRYVAENYHTVRPGGVWAGDNPTFAWLSTFSVYQSVLVQNLMNSLLLGNNTLIQTGYQAFGTPFAPGAGKTLQLVLYFGLAMSAYPGFFALYPTAEKIKKVRALQYSNGIRSLPLWSAYILFDFVFVLIISIVAIALFVGQWYGWYYPGYLFVVFMLYGLTSAVYSYVISLFTTSGLATFAFASGSQAVLFLIYFISYLSIITYAPVDRIDHFITVAHFSISTVTPSGNLARGILLSLNEFSILCRGYERASYPGALDVYGGPILYLIVQFFLLSAFLVYWDSGDRPSLRRKPKHRSTDPEEALTDVGHDTNIREELSRVKSSNDGLRVLHQTKRFGHVTAVEDVTFGVRKSEVFALLGPNGAGKSTVISLIRGDLRSSVNTANSDVVVEGASLSSNRAAARNHLGVCPQFDAIDAMTVEGHLQFYARVRGVPSVDHNVATVMHAVGLSTYANRLASKLSGGNKRKLSLAIALMGNPSVLLLDEPSSGMDAAAKRVMWRVLSSITAGRALLITTHSMEEADALADRAGIMAKNMLALGTSAELRRRHGDAWYVHMVHAEAPHTESGEMERMRTWVVENVAGAIVEERTYHGQLRFTVPNRRNANVGTGRTSASLEDGSDSDGIEKQADRSNNNGMALSALFALLEAHKSELRFAHYSVSPATLDQVFLNVVRKHNVEEENYGGDKKKKSAKKGGLLGMVRRKG